MRLISYLATTMLLLAALAVAAEAKTVTLSWDASPTASVTGYMVYYGTDANSLEYSKDIGAELTTQVADLPSGTWYFAVTAYNADAESAYSNMVDTTIAGFDPVTVEHVAVEVPATITIQISVE